jgi:branched-chain amino acid transport system ATP-binding protein
VTDPEPLLTARGVKKHFDGIKAVDGMDIDVYPGELVGLIGPNGAGKTTFFNVISGDPEPDAGEIHFDGEPIHGLPPYRTARKGLVRTFQLTRTLARMTVRENIMLAPKHQLGEHLWAPYVPFLARPRIASQERTNRERAEELIDYFDLGHLVDEYAGSLSGGQRKLLELARALMLEPEMLLLDEPMAGVNPTLANKLMDRIHGVREEMGITILLIEHDMDTVMNNCERVVVMAEGTELAEGTPEQIQDDPEVIDAYLGGG